ncbi:MAG: hypothetical protein WA913_13355 [Pricia sp.]
MKKTYQKILSAIVIVLSLTVFQNSSAQESTDDSILKKVADAHGFEHWKNVGNIQFTFNVNRGDDHFERSWVWNTKTNDVTATTAEGTVEYNRAEMDSTAEKTNANFINDKYWLLAPYQLVWDADNFEHEHSPETTAPISQKPMQKLTIVYGSEGGYTPGDAYDFYFMDDLMIREWVYRKGNQEDASMTTTWEEYQVFDGLRISTVHQNEEGNFRLFFTDIDVEME